MNSLFTESGADFSPCRRYRYNLWRRWGEGRLLNVIMLNPSTADEHVNDPTVERMERRAREWGYPGLAVTNLFAIRSTDPKVLRHATDPVGEENYHALRFVSKDAGLVLCAWGRDGRLFGRGDEVASMLVRLGRELYALRIGKDGQPAHPLYLPYSLAPFRWL